MKYRLLTYKEACLLLGISEPTLRKWREECKIDEVEVRGRKKTMISEKDILEFLNK